METIGLDKEELLDLYNTDLETLLELSKFSSSGSFPEVTISIYV